MQTTFSFGPEPTLVPLPKERFAFLLTGPNASGKTTVAQRAVASFRDDPRVRLVDLDNETGGFEIDQVEAHAREAWESHATVVVFVATNRGATVVGRVRVKQPSVRSLEAIVTSQDARSMEAHLRARCARSNKKYRDDYWTDRILTYEGQRRYAKLSLVWFKGCSTDWPIDIEYREAARLAEWLEERVRACLVS